MKPVLVLLHGWGASGRVFDSLRAALPNYATQAPDLQAVPGQSLDDWASSIAQDLPAACVLAGWSLGGLLALRIAKLWPHKVSRLVLLNTSPCFVASDDWPCAMPADTARQFAHSFADDPVATQKRFIGLQALGDSQRKSVTQSLAQSAAPAAKQQAALQHGLQRLFESDLRQHLASDVPSLILHGAHDALMPLAATQSLHANWPGSTLHIYPQAGHAVFLHAPQDCAHRIREFIDAS